MAGKRIVRRKTARISIIFGIGFWAVFLICMRQYHSRQREIYSEKLAYVQEAARQEKKWIKANQDGEGQIYLNYTDNKAKDVNPYFSCLAAQGLLAAEVSAEDLESVGRYLCWHSLHFQEEQGEISDYRMKDGALTSTGEADSVDSYTAVFLSLVCQYGEEGGDVRKIDPDGTVLRLGIETLEGLWSDGMTSVSPTNGVRYLMDNIEVQAALSDLKAYLERGGFSYLPEEETQRYIAVLGRMLEESRTGIETRLWDEREQRYHIGLGDSGRILTFEDWEQLYPDAVAQVYAAAFSEDAGRDKRIKRLYEKFCRAQDWETIDFAADHTFVWAVCCYIAAVVGDMERAETYLQEYRRIAEEGRKYPLHTAEAGWIVKACGQLEQEYQDILDRNMAEVIFGWIKEQVT